MRVVLVRAAAAAGLAVLLASCRKQPSAAAPEPASMAAPASASAAPPSDVEDVATRQTRAPGGPAPVVWLGFDALDFELVDRLAAEGKMPNWERLSAEGYTARLRSFVPLVSPVVWTTLATGVEPDVHRVLDFQEVDPATGQKVPISGTSRAVPAVWNVASARGLSVGVVGWWATHPAEEVNGFFVSDHVSPILVQNMSAEGVAFPEAIAPGVAKVAAREGRVADEELARGLGMSVSDVAAARTSPEGPRNPVVALARSIAATRVVSRIARELYDRRLPDLTMVYFEGTDVVAHVFAPYAPPPLPCVPAGEAARYGRAGDDYHALVDRILGQWMRRAREDGATLIVTSDHGFQWGADRSCERGSLNPAAHRLEGVFVAIGPGVTKGLPRGTASVLDVVPTVAALLGLPVDLRSAGAPIPAVAGARPAPPRRDLQAEVPVRRREARPMSEAQASEYAKSLMALGYLSARDPGRLAPSGGDRPGLTEGAWNNLGLYHFARGGARHFAAAEEAYLQALALAPEDANAKSNLALLRRERGEDARAIDGLFEALAAGLSGGEDVILDWTKFYQTNGKTARAREVLDRGARRYPGSEPVRRAFAVEEYKAHRCAPADAALSPFEEATRSPETLNALALIRACRGRPDEAVRLFRRSLTFQPGQETVLKALAMLEGGDANARRGS